MKKVFEVKSTDSEEKTWRVAYYEKSFFQSSFSLIKNIISDTNNEGRNLHYIKRID